MNNCGIVVLKKIRGCISRVILNLPAASRLVSESKRIKMNFVKNEK